VPLLAPDLALLAAKDLRLFRRDPAQVLQFTMFFGMLGFYLLMLPRLGRAFMLDEEWRHVVSVLNLTAISMALATFTGRFVFPMLSLEGRRLWVLALAPWPRQRIVTAKLVFALMVGVPVSLALTIISGLMLSLPGRLVAYQALVIAALAIGLASGALGLGARYADYTEDNPAKLVAGYGGTVNLLASVVFCGLLIGGAAVPLAAHAPWAWWTGIAWTLIVASGWSWLSLRHAWKRFGHLG
jgi:ABC-2 type transport system permease protein